MAITEEEYKKEEKILSKVRKLLKETLEDTKIADPAIQNIDNIVTSKTIDPNSFTFTETNITFKTRFTDTSNQTINGSTYQVTINGDKFSKPEFVRTN